MGMRLFLTMSLEQDKVKGPKILVQYYEGEVHLFKNKGQWRIGYAESKKVSERYE